MTPGLGPRITHARLSAGLSQDALATRLGLTRAFVRWLERRNTRTIASALLPRLAAACGVSVAYLEGTEAAQAPPLVGQDLGSRIVAARLHTGLSQEELAQQIGITRQNLSQLERNRKPQPRLRDVVKIAQVCHVDLNWLVGLTTEPHPTEGDVVYIVCTEAREVRGVYDTYAKAYAWIDDVLREDGVREGTFEWHRRHEQWDILQLVVQ